METLRKHALPLAIVVGAALRFYALGHQSFWYDEWDTVFMTQQSFGDMLERLGPVELTPPVYFVLTWLWAVPFGDSEFALRSLSALAGIGLIPVLYLAARDLVDRRAGLIVAWLAAVNPLLVWYSQEARSYSLMLLFTAAAFLFFVRALKSPDRGGRDLYLWGLASALAMATHYLSAVLIVPEAVLLWLWSGLPRRQLALALAPVIVVGLALLPLLADQTGHGSWISGLPLRLRAEGVPQNMAIGFYSPFKALPWIAVAGFVAVVLYAWRRGEGEERRGLLVALLVGAGGAALLLGPLVVGGDYVLTRNMLELWVPFGVAAGVALGARRLGWIGPAATAALAVVSAVLVGWVAADPKLQRPDWRDLADQVPPATAERLWVTMAQRGYNERPISLYIGPSRGLQNGAQQIAVSELVIARTKKIHSHAVGTCFWGALCNGNSGGYPFEPPPPFHLVQEGETDRFEFQRYVAPKPTLVPKFNGRGRYVEEPAGG
ncbi:MAG: glycosyltransferase family 39 protein [Solirubrobacterales bacterium]